MNEPAEEERDNVEDDDELRLSHDLRQPLLRNQTSIKATIELARKPIARDVSATVFAVAHPLLVPIHPCFLLPDLLFQPTPLPQLS